MTKSKFDLMWTEEQNIRAQAEGWCMALTVDDGKPISTAYYEVYDHGPKFPNRRQAMGFVVNQAQMKSKFHIEALGLRAASRMKK